MPQPLTIDPAELDAPTYKCTAVRFDDDDPQSYFYETWLVNAKELLPDGALGRSFLCRIWMTDELMADRETAIKTIKVSVSTELEWLQEDRAKSKE